MDFSRLKIAINELEDKKQKVSNLDNNGMFENNEKDIGYRECIGIVRLIMRTVERKTVDTLLDILYEGKYSGEDQWYLNTLREKVGNEWRMGNLIWIRNWLEQQEDTKLVIKDLDSKVDNPRNVRDPQELSLNSRSALLHSNLFIVLESSKTKVHIVKSRYF